MGGIWVHGELAGDGSLARISTEVATIARALGDESGEPVTGVVVGSAPGAAAAELARYVPRVIAIVEPATADNAAGTIVARHLAGLTGQHEPLVLLAGAGPEGRDLAGAVSALTGLGVLANATAVSWTDGGPEAEHSVFGGKLTTRSVLTAGRGIVTVRPNVVTAEAAATPGVVEATAAPAAPDGPTAAVVERIVAEAAAAPIEEAKVIVAGGRGVGGADGFALVGELAAALGGTVGATRAAVDSGWIPYGQQIGQTGKIVKPQLYLALGISGAIQHKVGMQTSGTIVAVNRDPDAPIADFADLFVVGDLFDVGRALLAALRARAT